MARIYLDRILELARSDATLTTDQIAARLGCRVSTVSAALKREGLEGASNAWTNKRVEILTAMVANGDSPRVIAARLDVTRNSVLGKKQRLGLSTPSKRKKAKKVRKVATPESLAAPIMPNLPSVPVVSKVDPLMPPPRDPEFIGPLFRPQIIHLNRMQCFWPFGDGAKDPEFHFCGREAEEGTSYCGHHVARAYSGKQYGPSPKPRW